MATHYYLVGVTRPTGGAGLTYASEEELQPGQLVEIAIRGAVGPGIVLEEVTKPAFKTQPITRLLELPPLPPALLTLGTWISDYYVCHPSSAWQTLLPSGALKSRRKRAIEVSKQKLASPAQLNPEQTAAVEVIENSTQTTNLLYGVTGSGKTEVYQELVRRQLALGKSAIILVPEIALTPQAEARFRAQFGGSVVITHSRLTEAGRFAIWQTVLTSEQPLVVIGPRSALFLPLPQIGIIIIDEAHETSYKQDQAPRFETAIVAAKLAHLTGSKLVLGSATPGLREAYLTERGVINRVNLSQQFNQLTAARPIVIDLKDQAQFRGNPIFSRTLLEHLDETYRHRRQSLLFLNRRGSASSQICTNCQHVTTCPNCRLPLVLHADQARMICHICNFHQTPPVVCPNCGQAALRFLGMGTKRIADELQRVFPKANIIRLDKDSLQSSDVETQYASLIGGEVDFLVGTQMVAKGLDLPQMETIGVILADLSLYLPDFTATERTYALLTQVSGRAGRGQHPGRTIIQTYSPDHPVIKALSSGDYWDFAAAELAERQALAYPPYAYLLKLSYSHTDDTRAEQAAETLAKDLSSASGIQVIGPAPAFRHWASGRSHWQLIVKAKTRASLQAIAAAVPTGWTTDLDPINLL